MGYSTHESADKDSAEEEEEDDALPAFPHRYHSSMDYAPELPFTISSGDKNALTNSTNYLAWLIRQMVTPLVDQVDNLRDEVARLAITASTLRTQNDSLATSCAALTVQVRQLQSTPRPATSAPAPPRQQRRQPPPPAVPGPVSYAAAARQPAPPAAPKPPKPAKQTLFKPEFTKVNREVVI